MVSLQDRKWKSFLLGELFEITIGKNIDKIRADSSGTEPYITRTTYRNGLEGFVAAESCYRNEKHPVITIGNETAQPFVQCYSFFTGTKVNILEPMSEISVRALLFIARCIEMSKGQFSYSFTANSTRLRSLRVMLPITDDNSPDYAFMDKFMELIQKKLLSAYMKNFLMPSKVTNCCFATTQWGDFAIADLFRIEAGKRLESYNMKEGNRPFIGASDSNNGITNFLSNDNCSKDCNVLGVNYNGSVGESFYHPYEALFSDDVKRFHLKQIPDDKYVLLFLKAAILKQKDKFDYGYKFNAERMARQRLVLPKASDGKPDYSFMRRFMMNAEAKLRRRYAEARLKTHDGASV